MFTGISGKGDEFKKASALAATKAAAHREKLLKGLEDAETKAESLSVEIYEVISPVHALLKRVCLNSVKHLKV